jgi:hypothetical protein
MRFYWPPAINPDEWTGFRLCDGTEGSKRHIAELSVHEAANVAAFLLEQGGSTSTKELAKSVCQAIGMARTVVDAELRAQEGVEFLISQGRACIDGDRVRKTR